MLTPILTDILLLVLLLVVLWIALRSSAKSTQQESTTRLDTRLEEHIKRIANIEDRLNQMQLDQQAAAAQLRERLIGSFAELREELRTILAEHSSNFDKRQTEALQRLSESLQSGMTNIQKQVGERLASYSDDLGKRMESLTQKTDQRLQEISGQVEKRLTEGFEKTTATFSDIIKRLALIDEAQKKITELSSNVVNLQEVLADKRSRGAFGEVQLSALVGNVMPDNNFKLQYTLPNGKIADCVLFLPEPTGMIVIDSKFPLENYRLMTDFDLAETERKKAEKQFKLDILKHVQAIAEKYIIPGTTSDGAVMFIPAEAVFAEIQAHHPDLVDKAHAARVWMVSPTTLWATLNTARTVLKDAATREQVHIIQEHLGVLGKDFGRFQKRMDDLAKHIKLAHEDVDKVNTSAKKITSRFEKIERVELGSEKQVTLTTMPVDDSDRMS
ncbi:MAG: DNA recombination protein RmuC [Gammaproteobacteria bacterium]|nr:DNA recombination protein RmuC [Gammaproteobacteria bacterium]